jgi:phosphoenolpyruvate carboxykinase (ATP)
MVSAALNGDLDGVPMVTEPYFGLSVPERVAGVPPEVLQPVKTWKDANRYEEQARSMVERFSKNFEKFRGNVSPEVLAAGPR